MQDPIKRLITLFSLTIFIATGCIKEEELPQRNQTGSTQTGIPLKLELVRVDLHIEDKNRMSPVGDATLLWDNRGHTPIMAPDGHQVTLGEFNKVAGKAEITFVNQATNVVMNLQGLIPNGVYSIWVQTFKLPGFHGSFVNLIGNGALRLNSGGENIFTASAAGTASISATVPAQSLSVFGSVGGCLCSEYEVHFMAAYHSNNYMQNGTSGNPNSWVTQFIFPFRGGR